MALKSREKILVFFVIIALAIWAFDQIYYLPQKKKISRLKAEIKAADLKLNEYMVLTEGMNTVEEEVGRLEKQLQGWRERMLKGMEFRAFLRHLARESHRLQMKLISLTPQEEKTPVSEGKKGTSVPQYKRIRINLVLHSTFPALGAYLKGIEELPFLVTIDDLQVERGEKNLPLLKVTMGLSVHVILL